MSITYEDIKRVNGEMQMTDIKGKDYAEVPQKVAAFRKLFPNGSITTEIVYLEGGMVVFKATIADEDGRILATGHAYEKEGSTFINRTSFIENGETSAVGRAASFLNLGSDTSIASYEEVMNAKKQQKKMDEDDLKAELKNLLMETESDTTKFLAWCSASFQRTIKAVDEMYEPELKEAIKAVKEAIKAVKRKEKK